ncbi:MAG: hypothetical protein H6728_03730 [Myxococcales bacterium]|nr:hypothetical protein [Myxococcales bacterium]
MQQQHHHKGRSSWSLRVSLFLWLVGLGCTPPSPACEDDVQCQPTQLCKDGRCTDNPFPDAQCSNDSGNNCPKCRSDQDCGVHQTCVSERCIEKLECATNDDCKGKVNAFCSPEGRCAFECQQDQHCADKTKPFCSNAHLCEWECKEDRHCKDEKRCKNNRCVLSAPECRDDQDCIGKARIFCSNLGKCEWQCKKNTDCDTWNETCEQNICKPKQGSCKLDSDCPQEEKCLRSRCVRSCKDPGTSSGCPLGQICRDVGMFCAETCSSYSQCRDGFVCVNSGTTCKETGCALEGHCIPWRLETGQGKRGDACHYTQSGCDGGQDLFCLITQYDQTSGICAQTCRPGQSGGCDQGEVCEISTCTVTKEESHNGCPHLGGLCVKTGLQQEGESCSHLPESTEHCAPGLQCEEGKCYNPCSPQQEQKSLGCGADQTCIPHWRSLKGGLCVSKGTQKEGQFCLLTSASPLQAFQYCAAGLFCQNYVCVKPCDAAKGKQNNPDCATEQECLAFKESPTGNLCVEIGAKEGERCSPQQPCVKTLTCETQTRASICSRACKDHKDCRPNQSCLPNRDGTRYCRNHCDPALGFVLNPACEGKTYCESSPDDSRRNHCLPLFLGIPGATTKGPTPLYDLCGPPAFPLYTKGCQFDLGQECISHEGHLFSRCFQTCDPKQGLLSNTTCDGAVCREFLTPEGGICEPLGTAKEGEACSLKAGCAKGLVCYGFKCTKACDPRIAGACGKGAFCWLQRCVKECNLSEGIHPNPACPSYTHCFNPRQKSTFRVTPARSYCESNTAPIEGTKQEGQACSNNNFLLSTQCDGNAGLLCSDVCRPVCDPQKGFFGNPACQKGQVCLVGNPHTLIGPPMGAGGSCAFACETPRDKSRGFLG